ncbi:MAG TPA: hypothetical protein VGF56_04415 [Rhizomicrobium sp.]|jgi:hypothetical protein
MNAHAHSPALIAASPPTRSLLRRQCDCGAHTGGSSCRTCTGQPRNAQSKQARPASEPGVHFNLSAITPTKVYAPPPKDPADSGAPQQKASPPGACKVSHLSMKFKPWNLSGLGTIRLPVKFRVELEKGVKREDCLIGQSKKGLVAHGYKEDSFSDWTKDAPIGALAWWDGGKWNAGFGSWDWNVLGGAEGADFEDEPGFNEVRAGDYPLYWGGVGRKGHFQFETFVRDAKSNSIVRKLDWGMLINHSAPNTGHHYFYR